MEEETAEMSTVNWFHQNYGGWRYILHLQHVDICNLSNTIVILISTHASILSTLMLTHIKILLTQCNVDMHHI